MTVQATPRTKYARPVPALSDLSVTEFLTLSRIGFLPHGMVIGCAVVREPPWPWKSTVLTSVGVHHQGCTSVTVAVTG